MKPMPNIMKIIIRQKRLRQLRPLQRKTRDRPVRELDDETLTLGIDIQTRPAEEIADPSRNVRAAERLGPEPQHRAHEADALDRVHVRPVGAVALLVEAAHDFLLHVGALGLGHQAVGVGVDGGLRAVPARADVGCVDVRDEAGCWRDLHVDSHAGAALPGADGGEVEEVGGFF